MKRLMFNNIKTITLAAALFTQSFTASANFLPENPNILVTAAADEKAIEVRLRNISGSGYKLELTDEKGNILMKEAINNQNLYAKRYVLNTLQDGVYELKIQKLLEITTQKVEVTSGNVRLLERKQTFMPYLKQKAKKLDVNVLQSKNGTITMNIFTNEGYKMFSDKQENILTLNKRYDLSQLPKGIYIVEIQTEDDSHYESIQL